MLEKVRNRETNKERRKKEFLYIYLALFSKLAYSRKQIWILLSEYLNITCLQPLFFFNLYSCLCWLRIGTGGTVLWHCIVCTELHLRLHIKCGQYLEQVKHYHLINKGCAPQALLLYSDF